MNLEGEEDEEEEEENRDMIQLFELSFHLFFRLLLLIPSLFVFFSLYLFYRHREVRGG